MALSLPKRGSRTPSGLILPSTTQLAPDLGDVFAQATKPKPVPAVKSPWAVFGRSAPEWAQCAWEGRSYTNPSQGNTLPGEVTFKTPGGIIAAIGGKGAAKTFTASMADVEWVQEYPGGKMFIAANTYQQAFDTGGAKVAELCKAIGLHYVHREKMVLDGQRFLNVYYFPDFGSYICICSFDSIKNIEGSEWGRGHYEEIQDCKQIHVATASSRIRHQIGDHSEVYCGMPDDGGHWMYAYFNRLGCPLYEPPLSENLKNVPGQIERLKKIYPDANDRLRYISGARISMHKSKALPKFQYDLHVTSPIARRLSGTVDPHSRIFATFDFNVAPLCASLWQVRMVRFGEKEGVAEGTYHPTSVQVANIEIWSGGTRQACRSILERYGGHNGGWTIMGDATGERGDTRNPGETDWSIISDEFSSESDVEIIPGVVKLKSRMGKLSSSLEDRKRKLKAKNPPVRDRINYLNDELTREDGTPMMLFLDEMESMESGGAARSCDQAKYGPNGLIDSANDAKDERHLPRTHFFDGVGYYAWLLRSVRLGMPGANLSPGVTEAAHMGSHRDTSALPPKEEHARLMAKRSEQERMPFKPQDKRGGWKGMAY